MKRPQSATDYVLVVDDDPAVLTAIAAIFWMQGIGCRTAASGDEALDIAALEPPELVLVDWNMPRMTGGDVLAYLRAEGSRVPVVLMSSNAASLAERARTYGFDGCLLKPFSLADLREIVDRLAPPRAA